MTNTNTKHKLGRKTVYWIVGALVALALIGGGTAYALTRKSAPGQSASSTSPTGTASVETTTTMT